MESIAYHHVRSVECDIPRMVRGTTLFATTTIRIRHYDHDGREAETRIDLYAPTIPPLIVQQAPKEVET